MTATDTEVPRPRSFLARGAAHPATLWAAFALVHAWLCFTNLVGSEYPLGDVTLVYKYWMNQAFTSGYWVGIDGPWVYPIVAIVPMVLARVFGTDNFATTWLAIVIVLDAVAFGYLIGWRGKKNTPIAWWWLAFLFLLGPIAVARIDAISVPLAIVGVLYIARRPRVAAVILTVAAWIKVWPGAIVLALVIAARERWQVLVAAALSSAAIVVVALAIGAGSNVFSFVTQQTNRGLQIEAPVSTVWLWEAIGGATGTHIYYSTTMLTYQIEGSGVAIVADLMTPLLVLAALAIVLLGLLAMRNRASASELLPVLVLALVSCMIAINKVGSPQFIGWLAVPVILGLVTSASGSGRSFRTPATIVAVLAILTQAIYPYLYNEVLTLAPGALAILTVRNALLFVLLGWAVTALWRLGSQRARESSPRL
jgi:Glycosyltransferase family 87